MERQKNAFGVKSLTEALKLKDLLAKNGIRASPMRTQNDNKGCGYSLYIDPRDIKKARAVLKRYGIETGGAV